MWLFFLTLKIGIFRFLVIFHKIKGCFSNNLPGSCWVPIQTSTGHQLVIISLLGGCMTNNVTFWYNVGYIWPWMIFNPDNLIYKHDRPPCSRLPKKGCPFQAIRGHIYQYCNCSKLFRKSVFHVILEADKHCIKFKLDKLSNKNDTFHWLSYDWSIMTNNVTFVVK